MASSSETPSGAPTPAPALVRALLHLLRPLVRLLLANHITYPFLTSLLKTVYLEIADHEFEIEGRRQTASRLSLITGLHRKDIRRLRGVSAEDFKPPASVSLGARLLARWTLSDEFTDEKGRPLALRRSSEAGDTPSFEQLVYSVSKDIRARSVLDGLLRLGVVEVDIDGSVRPVVDAFIPAKGFDEKAHYFGRNLHDHIAASTHNLSGEAPPMLERSVYYEGLSRESLAELSGLSEKLGMRTLQEINRRARKLKERDEASGQRRRRHRMNFGIYFFQTQEDDADEDASA